MSQVPKYEQIKVILRQRCLDEDIVGTRIPSTQQLSKELEVSVHTIDRAIRDLVQEGLQRPALGA